MLPLLCSRTIGKEVESVGAIFVSGLMLQTLNDRNSLSQTLVLCVGCASEQCAGREVERNL